ncbi:hypothetical protein XENTR_v10011484 [Xenopus tropicalis]|nr:hypothetical protein XENTR_v10011484 [Xenopus tropicalis]
MSLYLFMVLVSNNRAGQTHSRISGCIDVLLCLFREMPSSCNIDVPNRAKNWSYQLWSSVCSGLCACVNNPQNDENQKLCCSVFPQAKDLLKHSNDPEIVRPVCSFISFVVADNSFVQEYFASIGGLDTLADLFLQLVSNLQRRSSKLAVVVMKTVVACTANNTTCINCLSKYNIISCMLTLLTSEPLDPEDKCAVVLAIGRCTENCEGNQYELLKSNGLPVIIQILTESQNEQQLHKAATFVLQNCKNINPLTLCKDIIDKEICTILTSEITSDKSRCTGCLATELAMNSRNCTSILRDSSFLCDHHMVIVEAEEQYKRELKKLLQINGFLLTPLKTVKSSAVTSPEKERKKERGPRRNFTQSEVAYLLDGVQKFGPRWNSILWSYPFLKGRTNVNLSKKYKQLQKNLL